MSPKDSSEKFLKRTLILLKERPVLILPIFMTWIVIASIILYANYWFEFPDSIPLSILIVWLMIFVMALSMCFSNLLMLEFLQGMESGKKIQFFSAIKDVLIHDMIKVIPIAFIWSTVWLILDIIDTILTRYRPGDKDDEFSIQNAAETLSGIDSIGPGGVWRLGIYLLEKVIRMSVFLALPAIAWDDKGPFTSFKQAIIIIRTHTKQFFMNYVSTGLMVFALAIPLIPVYFISKFHIPMPDIFWMCVIIYSGFVWSAEIYLEQMTMSLLYLWHLKWVQNGSEGSIRRITKPNLMETSTLLAK